MKISKVLISTLYSLFFILFSAGCDTVKVQETIYLGDVDVQAPINTPPVKTILRNSGNTEIKVSPKLVINQNKNISTSTSGSFYSNLSPRDSLKPFFREQNLDWSFPDLLAGIDIDIPLSKSIFFAGGFHFSNIGNQSAIGGSAGFGIGGINGATAFRIDAGVLIQKHLYNAETVVKRVETYNDGSKKEFISIYSDNASTTNLNPYVTLNFNSAYEGLFNFYVGAGYFTQSLLGFIPSNYIGDRPWWLPVWNTGIEYIKTDKRNDVNIGFYFFSPGVIYKLMDNANALIGVKLLKTVGNDTKADSWMILPSIQVDFAF